MVRISRSVRRLLGQEGGFSLVELVVAMTIISGGFLALAHSMAGGMAALSASRQRSVFLELANGEMERLRAIPWESLGVADDDPDLATAYPGGAHDGRPAVLLDVDALVAADPAYEAPPAAVSVETSSPVSGVRLPFTIERWVTWSESPGIDGAMEVKQIDVVLRWDESGRGTRGVTLHSLRYPGGLGPADVGNAPPVASFTAGPTTGEAPLTVSFDGSMSSDPDLEVLTYDWQFGVVGATATTEAPSYSYALAGTYTVVLTVTDPSGATSSTSETIVVNVPAGGNSPPWAEFDAAPASGLAPLSVDFSAIDSYDPEGGPLTYSWDFGDGTPDGTGITAAHSFASVGTFTVMLTVTDDAGLTATATFDVVTTPLNCSITAAGFRNPNGNDVVNDIEVNGSGKPDNGSFTFFATSNTACTSMIGSIPMSSGALTVSLTATVSGDEKTWTGTVTTTERFNRALDQSGSFTGSGGETRAITFDVHT